MEAIIAQPASSYEGKNRALLASPVKSSLTFRSGEVARRVRRPLRRRRRAKSDRPKNDGI